MTTPIDELLVCVCGWRGDRRSLTLHPRQGFGVCPRCWSRGTERIPRAIERHGCTGTIRTSPFNAMCKACGLYGQRCDTTGKP